MFVIFQKTVKKLKQVLKNKVPVKHDTSAQGTKIKVQTFHGHVNLLYTLFWIYYTASQLTT